MAYSLMLFGLNGYPLRIVQWYHPSVPKVSFPLKLCLRNHLEIRGQTRLHISNRLIKNNFKENIIVKLFKIIILAKILEFTIVSVFILRKLKTTGNIKDIIVYICIDNNTYPSWAIWRVKYLFASCNYYISNYEQTLKL